MVRIKSCADLCRGCLVYGVLECGARSPLYSSAPVQIGLIGFKVNLVGCGVVADVLVVDGKLAANLKMRQSRQAPLGALGNTDAIETS